MPGWFANILLGIVGTLMAAWGWGVSTTILEHDKSLARLEFQVQQIYVNVVPADQRKANLK